MSRRYEDSCRIPAVIIVSRARSSLLGALEQKSRLVQWMRCRGRKTTPESAARAIEKLRVEEPKHCLSLSFCASRKWQKREGTVIGSNDPACWNLRQRPRYRSLGVGGSSTISRSHRFPVTGRVHPARLLPARHACRHPPLQLGLAPAATCWVVQPVRWCHTGPF